MLKERELRYVPRDCGARAIHLAAYKYPWHVEMLPELPKSPAGRLLRRELRERADHGTQ